MKKLRLGFIGGGLNSIAGYPHLVACQMDGRFEPICGYFSRNNITNKETGNYWGIKSYDSFESLIDQEKDNLDAMVVLAPTPDHFNYVTKILEQEIPVICEKPLFSDLDEINQFKKIYNPQKHFLAITYNYIAYPILFELKRLIQSGYFGDILNIHLEMPQESFLRPPKSVDYPPAWRKYDKKIPTIILDLASHLYSIMYFLTEKTIKSLTSATNKFSVYNVVDDVKAILSFDDETSGFLWISKTALGFRNGLKISIFGTNASAIWVQTEPEIITVSKTNGEKLILDRGSNLEISKIKIYNRMTPGHPAGFIEALGNLYCVLAEAIISFKKGEPFENPLLWTFEKEEDNFEFMNKLAMNKENNNGKII